MAEYQHSSATGAWFFQAIVASSKLDTMTKNARAAHVNKPRGTRYVESARITTDQTKQFEQTHMCLLSGVRVIRGGQCPIPADDNVAAYDRDNRPADVDRNSWIGDPQTMFPTGPGLPPFLTFPVVTCGILGFTIIKDAPDPDGGVNGPEDADYSFVDWFGGLDWGSNAVESTPGGIEYHTDPLTDDDFWPRCALAPALLRTQTGETGARDMRTGLCFRVIFGRVAGVYDWPQPAAIGVYSHPGAFYIHWHAMGPVAAY